MPRVLFFTVFLTVAVFQLVNCASITYYPSEIRQGRCTGDRLVNEDIVKSASPYTTKRLTYTWKGNNMYYITCINVYNKMSSSEGGTVRILEGGVGQSEAILEMVSKSGKGMHFHFELYGEVLNRSN